MAKLPKHPRLDDHDARCRRLACDYDKKYRPVVLAIAKAYNLWDDQHSLLSIRSVARETWRYTDDRKPLSERTVKRHLSELEALGVLKPDPRQRWNGSQASSIRVLDFHQSIRFGRAVEHLWDAPLRAEDDTPDDTPSDTPVTPLELSSISLKNSPFNSVKTGEKGASPNREIERGPGSARPAKEPARAKASSPAVEESSGMCNTYTYWQVKGSGNWVFFRADKPSRQTPPKSAKTVTLSPAEASFMWKHLRTRDDHVSFLRASKAVRSAMMSWSDRPDARAKREARQARLDKIEAEKEAREAAERDERAPLVLRYAELYGKDPQEVESLMLPMGDAAIRFLKERIADHPQWAAEQAVAAAEVPVLLERYAKMTGREAKSIKGLVDHQGPPTQQAAWLKKMIAQEEGKKPA